MCFPTDRPPRRAFSLLELLVVLAVVALLLGLLFPGLTSARDAADRARTRMRFGQWAAAVEAFRAEYGAYPDFGSDGLVNGSAGPDPREEHVFHDILAGRRRDGSPLGAGPPGSAAGQNFRGVEFHAFGEGEFVPAGEAAAGLLRDAHGSTSIAVLVDRNLDGRVDASDYAAWPEVHSATGVAVRPGPEDAPPSGVRAGVLFYSADPRATPASPRLVRSW